MSGVRSITKLANNSEVELLAIQLVRIGDNLQKQAERNVFRPHGISLSQYNVLETLQAHNGKTELENIAKHMVATPANLSNILKRLEDDQHIKRKISTDDRREILVEITSDGKKLYEKVRKLYVEKITQRFQKFSSKTLQTLNKELHKLHNSIIS